MNQLILKILVVVSFVLGTSVYALNVNRVNGGGTILYVDFSIPGDLVPLELTRSYNTITSLNEKTAWKGVFGWGWTSEIESVLTVTPDRSVVLRDGNTGNTIIFRPSKKNPKAQREFLDKLRVAYYERKLNRKLTANEKRSLKLPAPFLAQLRSDSQFRIRMALKYNISGDIPKGEMLVSTQYGYQTVTFKNNQWVRSKDGFSQIFDNQGRLVRQEDKNGYYMNFVYDKQSQQLKEIIAKDKVASLKFTWSRGKIQKIVDNQGRTSTYAYDSKGNLVRAKDSNGQIYEYEYKNKRFPHLLTKINYPNETKGDLKISREIRYDRNGLVIFHRSKTGATTLYKYGKKPNDPANNFWTKTTNKIKVALTDPDERYEEFFLKRRPDGSKYLYKQIARASYKIGGKRQTVNETIIFTACCGKPAQIIRGGQVTKFKYYGNGLLKEKVGPRESVKIQYEPRFMKVSKVVRNGQTSRYKYDGRGNLINARIDKKNVNLKYDRFGRIRRMTDAKGGQIKFRYGNLGKPVLIEQRGVGTIQIVYDQTGRIKRTETVLSGTGNRKPTATESKKIVKRVMKGFQNLLDIIRPAAQVNKALPLAWRVSDK